jgi:hypothetical protein
MAYLNQPKDLSEDAWRLLRMLAVATELRSGPYRFHGDSPNKITSYGWIMNNRTIIDAGVLCDLRLAGYLNDPDKTPAKDLLTAKGRAALQERV